ncbi:MAG: hypothetical protein M1834_000871 [Cirrosporium novae-zelandiae]|nr:MAG: hypothetical protein M1834_000871 [Cirrosporium novae-zelandiae]
MASLTAIPLWYRLFFLYIEPVATFLGAYYAFFLPQEYIHLTHAASAPDEVQLPLGVEIVLAQLANMYFAFVLNEALVLRATDDIRVWKTLLFGLLVADFGHLYSVKPLGAEIYVNVMKWNSIDWGNIAFVYCGAMTRIAFLFGLGFARSPKGNNAQMDKRMS